MRVVAVVVLGSTRSEVGIVATRSLVVRNLDTAVGLHMAVVDFLHMGSQKVALDKGYMELAGGLLRT
jgi:hypothetical protein